MISRFCEVLLRAAGLALLATAVVVILMGIVILIANW